MKRVVKQFAVVCWLAAVLAGSATIADDTALRRLAIEKRIAAYVPDPAYADDEYGLLVVRAAMQSNREGSGGIGACLVDSRSGKVVARGRNRQYIDYFRSDLHAEMDLLNRYEDRERKKRVPGRPDSIRDCSDLVLVTSVEPCPMCLTRIINSGVKTVLYLINDTEGGMAERVNMLPPFWREFAADRLFKKADCSPELQQLAHDLFHFSHRSFAKDRGRYEENKDQ